MKHAIKQYNNFFIVHVGILNVRFIAISGRINFAGHDVPAPCETLSRIHDLHSPVSGRAPPRCVQSQNCLQTLPVSAGGQTHF